MIERRAGARAPGVGEPEGAAAEEDGGVAVGGDDAGGDRGCAAAGGAVEVAVFDGPVAALGGDDVGCRAAAGVERVAHLAVRTAGDEAHRGVGCGAWLSGVRRGGGPGDV